MSDLVVAIGLVLAIEGFLYAAAPGAMLKAIRAIQDTDPRQLRIAGLAALALGVFIVWLVRG